jgi:hypothetical protein
VSFFCCYWRLLVLTGVAVARWVLSLGSARPSCGSSAPMLRLAASGAAVAVLSLWNSAHMNQHGFSRMPSCRQAALPPPLGVLPLSYRLFRIRTPRSNAVLERRTGRRLLSDSGTGLLNVTADQILLNANVSVSRQLSVGTDSASRTRHALSHARWHTRLT